MGRACRTLTLPWDMEALPTEATKDPGRCQTPVRGAPGEHTQATSAATDPTSVDLTGDLTDHRYQDCGTLKPGQQPRTSTDTHPMNQGEYLERRRHMAADAGSAVESLLASDTPMIREAWIRIWGWYKDAVDRPLIPSRVTIEHMTVDWL